MAMPQKSIYKVNVDDLPTIRARPPSQDGVRHAVEAKMVYGVDTGMMIAQRQKGYHSRPHYHDSEQFNYVLDGEIWFFIDDKGFRCVEGDIVRIPRNAIHWTWVRSEKGCKMLETHTPSLTGDPELSGAHLMVPSSETTEKPKGVTNIFVEYEKAAEVEQKALEADPD